ncbi:uncharacterized protein LOC135527632 [Oncorhynchus masou masou]|uniref:uncharacterized protein LOC135527632 n=1 Tax=Oncorhynchus masou masou TaxID=90313 RepID=UPI003183625E
MPVQSSHRLFMNVKQPFFHIWSGVPKEWIKNPPRPETNLRQTTVGGKGKAPVPPPCTSPPVAAPRTRLSLRFIPTELLRPALPEYPARPALPEYSALPEYPARPALPECPAQPESPARPARRESPACLGPISRVPSPRSAARVAVFRMPRRRTMRWRKTVLTSRARAATADRRPPRPSPLGFRFCGRSPHLWGGGTVMF